MQKDFHFYTIYALARSAGFNADNSHRIAYSSQHTDDAKYEHALEFVNGGRFQQVLTAHRYLDLDALHKATCYRIWIPFHFLPGNLGVDFYERMLTRSNSIIAQRIIEDFLASDLKAYSLHRLGIIMHVYADTWSHQNFLGLIHENLNDIKALKIKGETGDMFRMILKDLRRFPNFALNPSLPWQEMVDVISDLFETEGELDHRVQAWQKAISDGRFGFVSELKDKALTYDDREWFRKAVKVIEGADEPDHYERQEGFENSNWKYFHDAAAFQRFTILHEVLPDYGIICG